MDSKRKPIPHLSNEDEETMFTGIQTSISSLIPFR